MYVVLLLFFFFFSSRRRPTRCLSDWSSDVCSSDLISVREGRGGQWTLSVPFKNSWSLDTLLHDLVFHRGLYYYLCTVSNRRQIAASIVKPIFEELLSERFSVAFPVSLRKHLIEGSDDWVGGNFGRDGTAQKYEILFNEFNLKMISGYEFIRNVDDLLTELDRKSTRLNS